MGDWNSPPATFKFANTGNDRLMFLPQRHNREVLVRYPNRAIQSGESGEIEILYYTGETGAFSITVEIYTNASNKSEKLTVRGNIKSIYANALTACPSFQTPTPTRSTEPNVVQVVDAATNIPIPNASVEVFDRGIRKAINGTNLEGVAVNWIEPGKYIAIAYKEGYEKAEQEIAFTKRNRTQVVYLNQNLDESIVDSPQSTEQEPINLGIATNEQLDEENRQSLIDNRYSPIKEVDLGITTNILLEEDTEDLEGMDLGISSNEQWNEPVAVLEEIEEPVEEILDEDVELGINTNNQLEEPNRQLQIEKEVEKALEDAEMRVDVESPPEPEFSSIKYRPNNVLLLLDVSGSMKDDDKMDKLKASIRRLVLMLREVDVLTMIAYNSNSWEVLAPTPVTDNQAIVTLVDSLQASGYTNGVKGMEAAYESLEKQLITGGNNQLIIATDGKFNSSKFSEKDAVQMVKDNSDKGIVLSIIGFGEDKEAGRLMKKLATLGEGNFLQVKNNEDPTELLAEEIKNRSRLLP